MDLFSLSDGCKLDLDAVEFDPTDAVNKLLGSGASPTCPNAIYHAVSYHILLIIDFGLQILTQRRCSSS